MKKLILLLVSLVVAICTYSHTQNLQKDSKPNLVLGNNSLIIIDGKPHDHDILKSIKAEDIQSISILNDSSAIAIYGEKGKDGAIIISMKKTTNKPSFVDINKALILLDGKEISSDKFRRINHRQVDTIITLTDSIAIKKYGKKGKLGVIEITSKKENP